MVQHADVGGEYKPVMAGLEMQKSQRVKREMDKEADVGGARGREGMVW